jgi:Spy/CpxP family protein refolding chaperone
MSRRTFSVTFNRVLRTTILGLALAGFGLAQTPDPSDPGPARAHRGMKARRGAMNSQRLWRYLGLSDPQKAQAQTIFAHAKTAAEPIREQLGQSRRDLRAAIQADKPVDEISARQGTLVGQLTAIRAGAQQQFRALLTPEQLNKLQQLKNRRTQSES